MMLFIGITEFLCIIGFVGGIAGLIVQAIRRKKKWPWAVCIAVCFLIIGVCVSLTPEREMSKSTETPETTEVTTVPETTAAPTAVLEPEATTVPETTAAPTAALEPEPTTAPKTTAAPKSTELSLEEKTPVEQVEALAEKLFDFEYESLEVKEGIGLILVSYRPTCLYIDNSGWIRQNMSRYINFCRQAYQIEGMEPIRFNVLELGMDQYGEEGEFTGLDILMMPEDFALYKWDNLEWIPYNEKLLEDFRVLQIHKLFHEGFDPDKVFYEAAGPDGMIR